MNITTCDNTITYNRGDIFFADLGDDSRNIGSEQCGYQPVIILQNDKGNLYSPTVIVAIITSKLKKSLPTHVLFYDPEILDLPSTVCLEQIKTIDKSRLTNYRGNVKEDVMLKIGKALQVSFGTDETNGKNLSKSYVIRRDNKYIRVNENASLSMCFSLAEATKFRYEAANNVLNHQINPEVRHYYRVVHAKECDSHEADYEGEEPFLSKFNLSAGVMLKARINELASELSNYDKIILDIRHFAREESTKLNACQAAKVFYKLQQVERSRLKVKEEMSRLIEFEKAFEKAMASADEFAYPQYKPRCVDNMYEYIGI